MPAKAVPDRYHAVTPYIMVNGAAKVIDFAVEVFGGKLVERMNRSDGRVMHAEVQIGDSVVMVSDPGDQSKPMPAMLSSSIMEPADQFYGDRHGGVTDAAGNQWWIATHIEDVSPEELQRRSAAAFRAASER